MWPLAAVSFLQAWGQGCVLLAVLTFQWRLTAWQWVSNTEIENLPPKQKQQHCVTCFFLLLSCLLVGNTSQFFCIFQ